MNSQCTMHDFFLGSINSPCFTSWRYYAVLAVVFVCVATIGRLRR